MRSKEMIAGVALIAAAGVSGCTVEDYAPANTPSITATPESSAPSSSQFAPVYSPEQPPVYSSPAPVASPNAYIPGSMTQLLLAENAPINMIYIPVPRADQIVGPDKDHFDGEDTSDVQKFITGSDPQFREGILQAFTAATANRYAPTEISLTETQPMADANCLSNTDDAGNAAIDAVAAPYRVVGDLNFIFVEQAGCMVAGSDGQIGGYAGADIDPIISTDSIDDIAYTMVHEEGHSNGLDHAGIATCSNELAATGCSVDPTADPNSVMGYTYNNTALKYTAPELEQMGLLKGSEFIPDATQGTYTLVDINSPGLKVLSINSAQGPVYFSLETDAAAGYDDQCSPEKQNSDLDPNLDYFTDVTVNGRVTELACNKVNFRPISHTVQERIDSQGTLNIINPERKMMPNVVSNTYGHYVGHTLLYNDGTTSVVFDQYDNQSEASISVYNDAACANSACK
jgi:hypothetical protein